MNLTQQESPIQVVGIELRTSNAEAAKTIPAFWQRFFSERVLEKIPGKISNDIFAVYTNFEHSGTNNEGMYSLIIGAQVSDSSKASVELAGTTIPASKRLVFDVEKGRMDKVGEKWMEIWSYNGHRKAYVSDYERYEESGGIAIFVGVV